MVLKTLPQEQVTSTSVYSGWISARILCPLIERPADVADLENTGLSSDNPVLAIV
jgi:hypothetical protein